MAAVQYDICIYYYVCRKLKVLCDTIQLDRQAVKEVKTETQIMKRTKKEKLAAVKIARANMEVCVCEWTVT